ncbi:hypothetical protein JHK86_048184 [Glycine max]|nr:hypothetical protein JHK86_048184 [Glycine max]
MAALGRNIVVANTAGTFALLAVTAFGGFVISRKDVHKWLLWGYFSSPLMYGQAAIAVNEFLGHSWRKHSEIINQGYPKRSCSREMLQQLKSSISYKQERALLMEEVGENNKATDRGKRGMVLPFQPLSLTFDEIRYSVDMPQEMKSEGISEDRLELLKGISGAFRPGVLTALMGISGAGKTTLLDVLAGRKTSGYIEGSITISGYPKNQETFARIAGYCEQFDIHSPNVTVYESLLYSAWLRLSPKVDKATRKMFIEEVMELVELNSLREALVGLPGETGLSTEQRKRLTIAVELVANPSIIFMDEPTSGLDARAAAIVMRTVRNTVDTGRTVVCTIHQPSIDIFDAFDELLLLKLGGEQIYDGPIGNNSSNLIQYFEAIQGIPQIKDGYNPATWMLEVTSAAKEANLKVDLTEVYKNSELHSHRRKEQDVFNAMGSMYAAVTSIGVINGASVQPIVAIERNVFYRERAAGMYSALPYALAQVIIELPHILAQALIYGLIVYAMMGFEWTTSKVFWYLYYTYFTFLYYTFYGMMTMAITPNPHVAAILSTSFYAIWCLFSGFIIPLSRIPVWWKWYYWICPVSWTLYGLVASQYGDDMDKLENGQRIDEFVKRYFGFEHDFLGVVAIVVAGFSVLFALIFAFGIKVFNFQKR